MKLDFQILLKSPPPNLTGGIRSWFVESHARPQAKHAPESGIVTVVVSIIAVRLPVATISNLAFPWRPRRGGHVRDHQQRRQAAPLGNLHQEPRPEAGDVARAGPSRGLREGGRAFGGGAAAPYASNKPEVCQHMTFDRPAVKSRPNGSVVANRETTFAVKRRKMSSRAKFWET